MPNTNDTARLLISCMDRKGIVAKVSSILFDNGANITESSQHSTHEEIPQFFMRIVFDIEGLNRNEKTREKLERDIERLSSELEISYNINYLSKLKKMAILASKTDHCLNELLWLWKSGDIEADIPFVISNHGNLKNIADFYGIPFICIPSVSSGYGSTDNIRPDKGKGLETETGENEILNLMKKESIDFIVLARYMQVLSPDFLKSFGKKIINIHHSFLPSFPGAKPYEKAFEKGVKIIGATAHFVSEELDAGPIIEQDIIRVDHDDNVETLKRKGKTIERIVLSRAVKWFIEDRIMLKDNKTIVFV